MLVRQLPKANRTCDFLCEKKRLEMLIIIMMTPYDHVCRLRSSLCRLRSSLCRSLESNVKNAHPVGASLTVSWASKAQITPTLNRPNEFERANALGPDRSWPIGLNATIEGQICTARPDSSRFSLGHKFMIIKHLFLNFVFASRKVELFIWSVVNF